MSTRHWYLVQAFTSVCPAGDGGIVCGGEDAALYCLSTITLAPGERAEVRRSSEDDDGIITRTVIATADVDAKNVRTWCVKGRKPSRRLNVQWPQPPHGG